MLCINFCVCTGAHHTAPRPLRHTTSYLDVNRKSSYPRSVYLHTLMTSLFVFKTHKPRVQWNGIPTSACMHKSRLFKSVTLFLCHNARPTSFQPRLIRSHWWSQIRKAASHTEPILPDPQEYASVTTHQNRGEKSDYVPQSARERPKRVITRPKRLIEEL